MMSIELQVGESFFINESGYKELIFEVISKDDKREVLVGALDMPGLPRLEREFGYGVNVLRVHDVEPL